MVRTIALSWIGLFVLFVTFNSCQHNPSDMVPWANDTTRKDTLVVANHPCNDDSIYYYRDIQPIFTSYCAGNDCHSGPNPKGNVDLTSYLKTMASDKIEPGNYLNSEMYQVLKVNMPPTSPLSSDKISLIKKWIQQGAKDLWCDEMLGPCDTATVTYSGSIRAIFNIYCVGCHGNSGGISLTDYPGVKTVVDNKKLWNSINHLSGPGKAMPNSSTKLDACNIRQIKLWIDAGAPDN